MSMSHSARRGVSWLLMLENKSWLVAGSKYISLTDVPGMTGLSWRLPTDQSPAPGPHCLSTRHSQLVRNQRVAGTDWLTHHTSGHHHCSALFLHYKLLSNYQLPTSNYIFHFTINYSSFNFYTFSFYFFEGIE